MPNIPRDLKHQLRQCANLACLKSEACGETKLSRCSRCHITRYCSRECQRAHWKDHKPICGAASVSRQEDAELTAGDYLYAAQTGRTMSIPLENVTPLLRGFLATYRPLFWVSMISAFGYATNPPVSSESVSFDKAKVFYITLSAVPNLSLSTKARAAFLIKDAQALSMDSFRDSASNPQHPLYNTSHTDLVNGFSNQVTQLHRAYGPVHMINMCVLFIDFSNGVRRSQYFTDFYFADDPARNYSTQWKPDNWLEHLKMEVAKGKGWHRDDVSFLGRKNG